MNEIKRLTLVNAVIPRIENKAITLGKDIILVLSFAIATGICAKLKVEIGAVPITMQTFAVLSAGVLLGSKKGALSQIVYLLMGLAGFPWFARGGGMVYIFSPTFGYVIGFIFAAFLIGWLLERGAGKRLLSLFLTLVSGNLVIYLPGLLWLVRFVGLNQVCKIGFYPFLLGDFLKIFLAILSLFLVSRFIKISKIL